MRGFGAVFIAVFLAGLIAWPFAAAEAQHLVSNGGLTFSLAAGPRWYDAIGEGDIHPTPRSEAMTQLDVGYSFRCGWGASLGAHLGGSFFDFEGPGVSGDLRERSYGFTAGATRLLSVSSRSCARLGMGVDYGEAQSWLRNLVVERSGPHNYFFGGFFRAAMRWAIADHWLVGPDATVSIYHAHSVNTALQSDYDWMGSSAFLGLGVDFVLPHRESDTAVVPK